MKRLIIIPLLAIYIEAGDTRLAMVSEYKNMFTKIGEKRVGVDPREVDSIKPPFVQVDTNETKIVDGKEIALKPEYSLQAIVNDSAKISGAWYKVGENVNSMKVKSISKSGVVWLQNSEFKKRLTIRKENAKISIK